MKLVIVVVLETVTEIVAGVMVKGQVFIGNGCNSARVMMIVVLLEMIVANAFHYHQHYLFIA